MNKRHISCSHRHHIDNAVSSDDSPLVKNQEHISETEYENRNNHNSSLIHHDELPKSTSGITFRKRRTTAPYRSHSTVYINNSLLTLIRLMILLFIGFTFYYAFVYVYPKPKTNGWERAWYTMIKWLIGE